MAAAGVVDPPRRLVIDAVPDGEVQAVLLVHLERVVERGEHLAGLAEVGLGQRLRPQRVHGRDREQGRADAVAADVQQVEGEMVVVEPVVAERIAAQLGRGDEPPVGPDRRPS